MFLKKRLTNWFKQNSWTIPIPPGKSHHTGIEIRQIAHWS
jgi:hypothetical protein